jgi:hypothetical protein
MHPESNKEERICKRCYDSNLEKRFNAGRTLIEQKPEIPRLVSRLNPERSDILNVRPVSPFSTSHTPKTPQRILPTPSESKPNAGRSATPQASSVAQPEITFRPKNDHLPTFGGSNSKNLEVENSKEVDPMISEIMQQIKEQEEENRVLRKRLDLLSSRAAPPAKASGCGCVII